MSQTNLEFNLDIDEFVRNLKKSSDLIREFSADEKEAQQKRDALAKKQADTYEKLIKQLEKEGKLTKEQSKNVKEAQKEFVKLAGAVKQVDDKPVKDLNNEVDKTGKKAKGLGGIFKKAFTGIGGIITGALSVVGISSFIKSSIDGFRQQEKAVAKVNQAIQSTGNAANFTGKELAKIAQEQQGRTLFGDEQILNDATAQLLTFTNISNEQFTRTQSVALDLATVLDGDLKSASIQLGKALNDPAKNLSALTRSGIQFSNDQIKTIKALQETNDLAGAQNLILEELERQYGGQAAAAAEADGGITQLQNTFGDFREIAGKLFLEGLQPLIQSLKEFFASITEADIRKFLDTLKQIGKIILVGTAGFVAYKASITATNIATKAFAVAQNAVAVGQALLNGGLKAGAIAMKAFNAITKANPLGLIVTAVTSAVVAFKLFAGSANEAEKAQRNLNDIIREAGKATVAQKTNLEDLLKVARDENASKEERANAIEKLNALSPEYLGNITLENINSKETVTAIDGYIKALERKALAQAVQNKRQELANKLIEAETSSVNDNITAVDNLSNSLLFFFTSAEDQAKKNSATAEKNRKSTIEGIKEEIKATEDLIKKKIEGGDLSTSDLINSNDPVGETPVVSSNSDRKKANEERLKLKEEFEKAFNKIIEEGEKERINQLSGEERINAELEREQNRITQLQDILLQKGREAFGEQFELEESQLESISLLREQATLNADKKLSELRLKQKQEEENKRIEAEREAQAKIAEERQRFNGSITDLETQERLIVTNTEVDGSLNELQKQEKILAIQIEYAKKRIDLLRSTGEIEDTIRANEIQKILNDLESTQSELQANQDQFSLAKLLNVSEDEAGAIKDQFKQIMGDLLSIYEQGLQDQLDAKQRLVDGLNNQIDEQQSILEAEIQINENGKASNIQQEKERLEELQAQREVALEQQDAIRKRQERIDTAQQAVALITASANLFKTLSPGFPATLPLAIAGVATMFGAFASAKVQAQSATRLEQGGSSFGIFKGNRHASGGIDIGGGIEVEGEEAWSVFNRKATRKHGKEIEAFTNAINKDDFYSFVDSFSKPRELSVNQFDMSKIDNLQNIKADTERQKVILMGKSAGIDVSGVESRLDKLNNKPVYGETKDHYLILEKGVLKKYPK